MVTFIRNISNRVALLAALFPLMVWGQDSLSVNDLHLQQVNVTAKRSSRIHSRISAIDTETITADEICKAACCNLSESFERSASVDVSYADAATGMQTIRLLGLTGTYVQMLTENTPGMRGLGQLYGLEYIPAAWMQSVQVSKGTSSVLNGFEATAGQINVELFKPVHASPITITANLTDDPEAQLDILGGWEVTEDVSTAVLAHYQQTYMESDDNGDGFMDVPKIRQFNLINRWNWQKGDYTGQFYIHGIGDRRWAGTTTERNTVGKEPVYAINLRTCRLDGFFKNGYVFNADLGTSLGIIAAGSYHDLDNRYGNYRQWRASQGNAYLNAIFQTNFENERLDPEDNHEHKLSTGISVNYDNYKESATNLLSLLPTGVAGASSSTPILLDRSEVTPGVFAEYTYMYQDKLTLLVGLRGDWSNQYGFFVTPRMNVRYSPFDWWTIRGSVGLGYRSPNILADNAGFFPSSRSWEMKDYHWKQEKAVNSGATMLFTIPIQNRTLQISGEYYYTRFLDCVVDDVDADLHAITLYNLSDVLGAQSFSHSAQIEASMEILSGWTMTAAFRYTDVKQTAFNPIIKQYEMMDKALQNKFKAILSTTYITPKKGWKFDVTAQFNGPGRMPIGFTIPQESKQYMEKDGIVYHKWYPQLMAQITKNFHNASLWIGAENMTNFTQNKPVVAADDPYSKHFDASMVWAPIAKWGLYIGFSWGIPHEHKHEHGHGHEHEDADEG